MRFNVQFQINDEKILVTSEQKNYYREYKNIIALDPNNKIAAIGQTLDELIVENPQFEDRLRKELKFEPLYTVDKDGLEKIFIFILYELNRILHGEMIMSRLLKIYSPICFLELPDYEKINEDFRKQFEYSLFQNGVNELYINNIISSWKKWQRNTLKLSNLIIPILSFLLWYLFLANTNHYKYSWNWALLLIVWLMMLPIISYFLILIRILILRTFLPHDLLRLELVERVKGFESIWSRFLRDFLNET